MWYLQGHHGSFQADAVEQDLGHLQQRIEGPSGIRKAWLLFLARVITNL